MKIKDRVEHQVSSQFIGAVPYGVEVRSTLRIDSSTVISRDHTTRNIEEAKRRNTRHILQLLINELIDGVLNE